MSYESILVETRDRVGLIGEKEQIEAARDPGVCVRPYFPGISDMSFLNPVADGSAEKQAAGG